MADYYPPVAFSFSVSIASDSQGVDASFNEASGLESQFATDEIREGGENRFIHHVPTCASHPNLVLKRGLMVASSKLFRWAKEVLEGGLATQIKPQSVLVSLLDQTHQPMLAWSLDGAWPVKWTVEPLNAQENKVAVETLEFAYGAMTRKLIRTKPKTGMLQP